MKRGHCDFQLQGCRVSRLFCGTINCLYRRSKSVLSNDLLSLSDAGSTVETIVSIHAGLSIVVSAVVILFYTSLGGLFSVVYCDSFQIICTTVGLVRFYASRLFSYAA